MKGDIEILICQLRDGRPTTRASAARALSDHPTHLARKDLLRCLHDTDDQVRYWATLALAGLDDERLVGRIAAQLDDPAPQVRMITAKVLSGKPYRGALPSLIQNLGDSFEDVAYWSGQALFTLGEYALPQLVATLGDESWKRREGASRVLERLGPPVIPHLVRALARDDANVRYWTLRLLGNLRAFDATSELINFLSSKDRDLVIASAEALGVMGDRRAIPELISKLAHPDEGVRNAIIRALSRLPDEAVHELTQLLASNERMARLSSSLALAAAGDTSLKPLLDRLAEDSSEIRFWVVNALSQLDNPVVIPVLEDLLEDESPDVQRAAARALGKYRLEPETARRLLDRFDAEDWLVRQALSECLALQTHLPLSMYEKALESGSEHQRYWVTKILGGYRTAEVVPLLLSRFSDQSWPIRKNAAASISRIGAPASRYLIEVLAIPNLESNLKYWVSRAMVGLEDPALVPTLVSLLADPDGSVRENARLAIERQGERAVGQLLESLRVATSRTQRDGISRVLATVGVNQVEQIASLFQFRDIEVSYWTAQTLARMGEPAEKTLVDMVGEPDERIRYQALAALGSLGGDRAIDASIEALSDGYNSVRRLAIENLGRLKATRAIGALTKLLDTVDADLAGEILKALGAIGDPQAAKAVSARLAHERWEVRRYAIEALGRIGGDEARSTLHQMLRQEKSADHLAFLIRACGDAGVTEAAEELVKLLSRQDEITMEALDALGRMKALPSQSQILDLLDSPSWQVQRAALRALGLLAANFDLGRLKPILSGEDLMLRHEAWQTLKTVLGPRRWRDLQRLTIEKALREPAEELFNQAIEQASAKQHEEALKTIRRALRLSKRPEYYALQGSIHLELRNVNQAIRSLKRAVMERADPVSACKLAVAHFIGRDFRRALAVFRQVLRMSDSPPPVIQLAKSSIQKIQELLKD